MWHTNCGDRTLDGTEAKAGDSIGVKVSDRVRSGDKVYKITD